ncbi:unnamed protein product [Lactuca saligna]|uniref:Uncharacterized protein n=1 Tax=Lactuca saligna TaxID=75948 RepID=A0AA35Z9G2_LACSI|nr:unnamed protein product [Lactuca saligna]
MDDFLASILHNPSLDFFKTFLQRYRKPSHIVVECGLHSPITCYQKPINLLCFLAQRLPLFYLLFKAIPMLAKESLKALGGLGFLSLGGKFLLRHFQVAAEARSSEDFVAHCLLTVAGTSLITQKLATYL